MTKLDTKTLAMIVAAVVQTLDKQPAKAARKARYSVKAAVKAAPKSSLDKKAERKLQLELLTREAFEKAGFENVVPRVNVMTAGLWAATGKTVLAGQQPLWVKGPWMSAKQMGYPMFHISQVA
jgi:hypothetical protein